MNYSTAPDYLAFMSALRGVPTHVVAKRLAWQTPGINWSRTPKSAMAEYYANARTKGVTVVFPQMAKVDLKRLATDCGARP